MEPAPEQVLKAARAGRQTAAIELIELFYPRIYAFLRRLTANEADAADLTQRTFSRVWQGLPRFEGRSSVSSWMHSIAYHAFLDYRRANRQAEPRSPEWWAEQSAEGESPDELAANRDLAGAVYASVDKLDADLRDTVHLHYYQGLTLEETAAALDIAGSTVKYRLRLALKELQKQFAREPFPARQQQNAK